MHAEIMTDLMQVKETVVTMFEMSRDPCVESDREDLHQVMFW